MTTAVSPKTMQWVLLIGMVAYATQGVGAGMLGVAWPAIRDTFGLSLDAVGWLLLVFTLGHLVSSFNNGRLLNWLSLGWALVLGASLSMVGMSMLALAPAWWVMIAFGFVGGMGMGIISPALNTRIAAANSPRLMNFLHASFGLGAIISPVLATAIITGGGSWRLAYGLLAALHLLTALVFLQTRRLWLVPTAVDASGVDTAVSFRDTFARPLTWLSILLFFVYTGMESTTGQWAFVLFTEKRGMTAEATGLWLSLFWACMTAGRLLLGPLAGRVGINAVVRGSTAVVLLGALLLWLNVGGQSLYALAVIGSGLAAIFPLLMTATPQRLGSAHAANAIGFQTAAAGMGASLLPGLAGMIADRWGLETIGPFLVATAVALLLLHEAVLRRERTVQSRPN